MKDKERIFAGNVLKEGVNCWRKRKARRAAFLVDAASYYRAFVRAVEQAKSSIYITGWDIDSRVSLLRDDSVRRKSTELGPFLDRVVSSKRHLNAYLLIWDFSMIFMLERELFTNYKLGWKTHGRIHFKLDGDHPIGASHHQKIVVVDNSLAFVGGIDLTKSRWDTPEHIMNDPRRSDPDGTLYLPFHDVQMLVDGPAAAALGDIFRKRWLNATGQQLDADQIRDDLSWPADRPPDLTDVQVAIARTEPAYKANPEVREVEALYLHAIASAKKYIYTENQYVTSSAITDALAKRLVEPDGPEIVMVLPHKSSGWLETRTMDTLRYLVLKNLRDKDKFGRFRVYYPVVPGMENGDMMIHSKVLIVDDDLVRIGSSNLTNRSMGFDTECDLAIEANGDPQIQRQISLLRNQLMAEHLGVSIESVNEKLTQENSLLATLEHLRNSDRTLKPLTLEVPEWLETIGPTLSLVDPEKPIDPADMVQWFVPEQSRSIGSSSPWKFWVIILLLVGLWVAWQWGPLGKWINVHVLADWGSQVRSNAAAPLIIPAAFVLGGVLMVPLMLMIGAVAIIFDPIQGALYAFAGSLASATVTYWIGRSMGRRTIRTIAGSWLNTISQRLRNMGFLTITTLRLIPIAPFTIVNLVMGASGVRFRHYIVGTLLGLAPGIISINAFAGSVVELFQRPGIKSLIILVFIAVVIFAFFYWIKARLKAQPS